MLRVKSVTKRGCYKRDFTLKDRIKALLADPHGPRLSSKRELAEYLQCGERTLQSSVDMELWRLSWKAVGKTDREIAAILRRKTQAKQEAPPKPPPPSAHERLAPVLARFKASWCPGWITLDGAVTILGKRLTAGNRWAVILAAREVGLHISAWERRGSAKAKLANPGPLQYRIFTEGDSVERTEGWEIVLSQTPYVCPWSPGCPQRQRGRPAQPEDYPA